MARQDDTPEAWQIDFPSQEAENHDEAEQEVIGFRHIGFRQP